MLDAATISDQIPLPTPPEGWFDYGYTALMDGRLALVRTRRNFHAEWWRWRDSVLAGQNQPQPDLDGDIIRLTAFDGAAETDEVEVRASRFPLVDRTADGLWLIADAGTVRNVANARFYRRDGTVERTIALGDAIENLACSPDGTIWVGYFDEGALTGAWPSTGGIVNFDSDGRALWMLNENLASADPVDDCYALSLTGEELWTSYYSEFPIVRIQGRLVRAWSNSVRGAKSIAASGDIAVLGGGYGEEADLIRIVKLKDDRSAVVARLSFRAPTPATAQTMQGRDGTLHVVRDGIWHRLGKETFASGRSLSERVRRALRPDGS